MDNPIPKITNIGHFPYFVERLRLCYGAHIAKFKITCSTNNVPIANLQEVFVHHYNKMSLHGMKDNQYLFNIMHWELRSWLIIDHWALPLVWKRSHGPQDWVIMREWIIIMVEYKIIRNEWWTMRSHMILWWVYLSMIYVVWNQTIMSIDATTYTQAKSLDMNCSYTPIICIPIILLHRIWAFFPLSITIDFISRMHR